jgi:hypothetical protein
VGSPASGRSGQSMMATYVTVVVLEVVTLALLWWFSRAFA